MKITAQRIDRANARATVIVSNDFLKKQEKKIVAAIAKDLKMAGFRKGKVPAQIIKTKYGHKITQDTRNDALRAAYQGALKELGVKAADVIGDPGVSKFETSAKGLEIELALDIQPEFSIAGYKELIPDFSEQETSTGENRQRFADRLLDRIRFDVPQGIVNNELDISLRTEIAKLSPEESKAFQRRDAVDKKKAELREDALKRVRLTFIVHEMAKKENVTASQKEVEEAITQEARQAGQDPAAYLKEYTSQGLLPAAKMALIEKKLFKKLLDQKAAVDR
ncbi:MAG: hypothetical protein JRK53_04780 [Deltaproteobacteria bacterium]|nr:hypothetical protein [Deltaproteobacteria bacterium]